MAAYLPDPITMSDHDLRAAVQELGDGAPTPPAGMRAYNVHVRSKGDVIESYTVYAPNERRARRLAVERTVRKGKHSVTAASSERVDATEVSE